jgi:hypothetical protein
VRVGRAGEPMGEQGDLSRVKKKRELERCTELKK